MWILYKLYILGVMPNKRVELVRMVAYFSMKAIHRILYLCYVPLKHSLPTGTQWQNKTRKHFKPPDVREKCKWLHTFSTPIHSTTLSCEFGWLQIQAQRSVKKVCPTFSSSFLKANMAFSRSATSSSRYWYRSFFRALHSLALCLLRSETTTKLLLWVGYMVIILQKWDQS